MNIRLSRSAPALALGALLLLHPLASAAEDAAFEFMEPKAFPTLASFESVEAFEKYIGDYMQRCFDRWASSSPGAKCPVRSELWDRELNVAYKRLMKVFPDAGKQKLKVSQRNWIVSRDSTIDISTYTLDRHFDVGGTMWVTPRADAADEVLGNIVKARTLLVIRWEKMVSEPLSESF